MYFDSHYISNSDLKRLKVILNPNYRDPADLEEIFSFGTLFHALVLEPHKADYKHKDYELAARMCKQFFNDPLCRKIFLDAYDLRREHEYYRKECFGLPARCKVDFESKKLSLCGELKGLKISSDRQLDEAVNHHDYDQAVAWYLDVTGHKNYFMSVPSKVAEKTFRRLVDRNHPYYKNGREKAIKSAKLFKETLMPAA